VTGAATERLGPYEILHPIARGGMAEILLARTTGLGGFEKRIAIKRILPQFAGDPAFVNMFLDEGRIAATLHHSNIVQVIDIGSDDGRYFLAMEYLHGVDARRMQVAARNQGLKLPIEVALAIGIGACAGLHYAHEMRGRDGLLGVVHRDISPQNIIVTFDGGVKVVDFGIAKAVDRLAETRVGTVKGKIAYMSPEQARGEPVDRRSDLFSMAIVLWELTTGRGLFRGSDFDVMKMIVEKDAPRPSQTVPGYPPELERIVLRGLARDPEKRYQTAQEMEDDLGELTRSRPAASPPDLARFMARLFGDAVAGEQPGSDQAAKILSTLIQDIDRTGTDDEGVARLDGPTSGERPAALDGGRRQTRAVGGVGQRRLPRVALLAAAGVLVCAVAGGAWWLHRRGEPAAPTTIAASPTGPTVPAVPAAAPPEVTPPPRSTPPAASPMATAPHHSSASVTSPSSARRRTKAEPAKKTWNRDSALLPP
jgi:serine/threonine protein kinase